MLERFAPGGIRFQEVQAAFGSLEDGVGFGLHLPHERQVIRGPVRDVDARFPE